MPTRFWLPTPKMISSEFSQYLTDITRLPVLDREAQLRHCKNIHRWVHWEEGRHNAPRKVVRSGERSLQVMVETNLRLVVSIAKKYQNKGVDLQDLIQEGNIGLIRGLELFDPTRGYQVSTYCYWWVRQGVTRAIHTYARTIRMPINSRELLVKIQRWHADYLITHNGKWPSAEQVAEGLNLRVDRVLDLLELWDKTQCSSLDLHIQGNDRADARGSVGDLIACPKSLEDLEDKIDYEPGNPYLQAAIEKLTDHEQTVINGFFIEGRTQALIGEELNVSRARVGQIQQRALKKLAQNMYV